MNIITPPRNEDHLKCNRFINGTRRVISLFNTMSVRTHFFLQVSFVKPQESKIRVLILIPHSSLTAVFGLGTNGATFLRRIARNLYLSTCPNDMIHLMILVPSLYSRSSSGIAKIERS